MTPQQEALNSQIKDLEVITVIESDIEGLAEGQKCILETIEEEKIIVRDEFKKGSEKFDRLEKRIDTMESNIVKGFSDLRGELKDEKLQKLTNQIEKQQTGKDSIKNALIIALLSALIFSGINAIFETDKAKIEKALVR